MNRPSVASSDCKRQRYGGPGGYVGSSPSWYLFQSLTKDIKDGSGPCLHDTLDEVGTTKHN